MGTTRRLVTGLLRRTATPLFACALLFGTPHYPDFPLGGLVLILAMGLPLMLEIFLPWFYNLEPYQGVLNVVRVIVLVFSCTWGYLALTSPWLDDERLSAEVMNEMFVHICRAESLEGVVQFSPDGPSEADARKVFRSLRRSRQDRLCSGEVFTNLTPRPPDEDRGAKYAGNDGWYCVPYHAAAFTCLENAGTNEKPVWVLRVLEDWRP